MKRLLAVLVAIVGMAACLVGFTPTPASAHTDACAGLGSAHTGAPLVYPGVSLTAQNTTFAFGLGTGACVGGGLLAAAGNVSGWCGLSSGEGTTNTGHRFVWLGVGGTLVVTGEVLGVVNAAPNVLLGDSCLSGADDFLVNGGGVLYHCNFIKSKTKSNPFDNWWVWLKICI